nr:hypothetical protein [Edaphobacter aggregans]
MNIRITDSTAVQRLVLDQSANLIRLREHGIRQVVYRCKSLLSLAQRAKCQLANDKRVHKNISAIQLREQSGIASTQVINPH